MFAALRSELMVAPTSMNSGRTKPLTSQKEVSATLPVEGAVLKFFDPPPNICDGIPLIVSCFQIRNDALAHVPGDNVAQKFVASGHNNCRKISIRLFQFLAFGELVRLAIIAFTYSRETTSLFVTAC
jgi:hypothetical protein